MKYLLITTLFLIFSQNIYADEVVGKTGIVDSSESTQYESTEVSRIDDISEFTTAGGSEFESTNIEFSTINYYEDADNPDYKPKKRVLLGGIVPFIPIRSTIDKSVEDPGLVQKSVSFLLYFKQNF